MNIVLVGFMGTGKTTLARRLAEILKLEYVSTDELIEKRENRTINDIFTEDGEEYFRKVEKEVIKEVASRDNQVIDAGGGVVLDSQNVEFLKNNGIIICLTARAEVILERMKDKTDRPLLNTPNKLKKIKELLEYRKPFYDCGDYFIDTSDLGIEEVIKKVLEIVAPRINT